MPAALQLPPDVESMRAEEILRYCLGTFPGRVALACSFQKEESVLLDLLFGLEPKARVFSIDTHSRRKCVWVALRLEIGTSRTGRSPRRLR